MLMIAIRRSLMAACVASSVSHGAYLGTFTGTFETIEDPYCYSPSVYNYFTDGGQYLDAGNGVIDGVHSMNARWQGSSFVTNVVSYDMGRWNGAHIVDQRGYQPENSTSGSGGVSVNCYDFGMLINTKFNAHRPVVGGGYNDMYGFSWPAGSGPRPFTKNGLLTDLVLQGNVGLSSFIPMAAGTWATSLDAGSANVAFFAYLRDTTHSSLPPIAVLAVTHADTSYAGLLPSGTPAQWDYSQNDSATWATKMSGTGWSIPTSDSGIWYVGGPILANSSNLNDYVTTYYTAGQTTVPTAGTDTGGSPSMPFFRAHIRPEDFQKALAKIASNPCSGLPACPSKGYSSNTNDYELAYAGLIVEATVRHDNLDYNPPTSNFDTSPTVWTANDMSKAQVMLGVHGYGLGIYRGIR